MNHFLNTVSATVNMNVQDFLGNSEGVCASENPFEIWVSAISLLRDFENTLFAVASILDDDSENEAFLSTFRTKKRLISDICRYRELTIQYCTCCLEEMLTVVDTEISREGVLKKAIRAKILRIEARYSGDCYAVQFRVNYSDPKYDGEWLV